MAIESSAFPWLKYLPEDEVFEFLRDLREAINNLPRDAKSLGQVDVEIASWKSTAEVHADPELYKVLTTEHTADDFGDAPRPGEGRLLDCGYCYEEQGEEIHPHPDCKKPGVRKPSKARKLCVANTMIYGDTATLWCNKFADHTGDHVSRNGFHWPNPKLSNTVPNQREGGHENE